MVSVTFMVNFYYIYGWYYIYGFYYIYGWCKPILNNTMDTIELKFCSKYLMIYSIKCFTEVQEYLNLQGGLY